MFVYRVLKNYFQLILVNKASEKAFEFQKVFLVKLKNLLFQNGL